MATLVSHCRCLSERKQVRRSRFTIWKGRSNSWSLHPEPGTETYRRGGFFIHGGGRWGSKGCIDLENGDSQLHHLFKGICNAECCYIPLSVKYSVQQDTKSDDILDYSISNPTQ